MSDRQEKMIHAVREMFTEVRQACFNPAEIKQIILPMSDGVKMQTILCMPQGEGPWPALLCRTPYPHIEGYFNVLGQEYAKRGYAFVYQFCRGTNKSEGIWEPNVHERSDGLDTVNWLDRQDWCESIGIHGVSYMALTGWIIADMLPPKVKGLYLCHYGVDRYLSAYKAGLFRHDILTGWAMTNAGKKITDDFKNDYIKSALYRPHARVDEDIWGVKLDWYKNWITNTDYDSEYWQSGIWKQLREIPPKINVPACIVAGWFDHHLEGTVLGYQILGEASKRHSRLIVGAWNHGFVPAIPGHKQENATLNMQKVMLDWFDKLLIQKVKPEPEIKTYMIGDDEWRIWPSWPIKAPESKNLFLTTSPVDNLRAYRLSDEKQLESDVVEYRYDPENPVYTRGGETVFVTEEQRGSVKQEKAGLRDDVVSFLSDEFVQDCSVAGNIKVKLFVSSDCEDTCFTAKIMEVLPDGDAYNIRSGITTLAYRNSAAKRMEYQPGRVEEIIIEMLPVTWVIHGGSKLRIDISSSNFPEYSVHSNYPEIWSQQDKTRIANQKLLIGNEYNASIILPVADQQN